MTGQQRLPTAGDPTVPAGRTARAVRPVVRSWFVPLAVGLLLIFLGPESAAGANSSAWALVIGGVYAGLSLILVRTQARETARAIACLRHVADGTPEAVFVLDGRDRVLWANAAAAALANRPAAELPGRSVSACVPTPVAARLAGRDGEGGACPASASGGTAAYRVRRFPYPAAGGAVAIAVTPRRVARRRVLRSNERSYRLLFEANPLPMWVYQSDTLAFLAVNRAAVAKYGYTADEFRAMTLRDIRPAEDVERVERAAAAVAGPSDSGVWRHRLKDGTLVQVRIFSRPITFQGRPARLVMAHDVTAQLDAERSLRESEEQLRWTLEASATGLWGWNLDDDTVRWEAGRVPGLSGLSEGDATAAGADRMLHPEDRERVWAAARRAVATREMFECEFRVLDPGRGEHWVAVRGRAAYSGDGRPVRMVGTVTDVTARKSTELELRKTRAVLQNLIDHSPALIFMTDAGGRYQLFNRRCEAAFGVRAADVLGKTPGAAFPTALAAQLMRPDHAARAGKALTLEEAIQTPDGTAHFSTVLFPVADPDGKVIALGGVAIDVTDRKRAENELRAREELFRLLADESPHIIWVCDADGRPDYINRRWREYSGQMAAQASGHGWADAVHPDDRDRYLQSWREALAQGTEHETQVRLRRADGTYRWFLSRAKPVAGRGRPPRWFGASTDIEEQKRREDELLQADSQKDGFLATLAHELRNPLAPIADAAHLLGTADLSAERLREIQHLLDGQVRVLKRLVDDLADLGRVRRGAVRLRCEVICLDEVVRTAVETSGAHVRTAQHHLSVECPSAGPLVRGDVVRLAQVVSNLLTNAAKYTPAGGNIRLAVSRDGADAVVRVRDDGHGIDPAVLPRIFDMFVQEERLQKRTPGGLGVGLTLVRQIVELHGGTVEAQSAGPGRGAEFIVRLPLAGPAEPTRPEPRPAPAPAPLRLLVVDDNAAVARSFSWALSSSGHVVAVAHDCEAALTQVREFRPDVILLDIGLPGTNGCDVARTIRELPEGRGLMLVAATGWGAPADRLRTHAAGFDHHLTKPVDHHELAAILARVVPAGASSDAGGA